MATMMTYRCLQQSYHELCYFVLEQGRESAPRGMKTRELQDVVLVFSEPKESLPVGTGRKLNPALGVAEALQLISGRTEPDLLCRITPNMRQFMHESPTGLVQHGAYGPRAGWQTGKVVHRLEVDPGTRQAVISVYSPALDLHEPPPKDVPCTLSIVLRVHDGYLYATTVMRSNDIWWGLAYDAFQFTQLQCSIAKTLDVHPGTYTHVAHSLHVYERDFESARGLRRPAPSDVVKVNGVGRRGMSWETIEERASTLLDGRLPRDPTTSERWMWDHLHPYTIKDC